MRGDKLLSYIKRKIQTNIVDMFLNLCYNEL